jgi:glycosyltransferase involved in cell wall biosynthesis
MNKLVILSEGPLIPSGRFRAHQLLPGLRAKGWDCEIHSAYGPAYNTAVNQPWGPLYKAICRASRALQAARPRRGNVVIFSQKMSLPSFAWPERLAARSGPLVFDFDDALFLGADGSPNRARTAAFERVTRAAAHVVAGNEYLASHVPSLVPRSVIPTAIDVATYAPRPRVGNGPIVFGWMGTASNFPSVRAALPWLLKGLDRVHGSRLRIVSNGNIREVHDNARVDLRSWSAETEVDDLAGFDVGLMPLEDSASARGKCGFKLIEYMAMGKPVIAAAVGANTAIVGPPGTGLLVRRLEDWPDAMARLGNDPTFAAAAGAAGRRHVEQHYALAAAIERYDAIFHQVAGGAL